MTQIVTFVNNSHSRRQDLSELMSRNATTGCLEPQHSSSSCTSSEEKKTAALRWADLADPPHQVTQQMDEKHLILLPSHTAQSTSLPGYPCGVQNLKLITRNNKHTLRAFTKHSANALPKSQSHKRRELFWTGRSYRGMTTRHGLGSSASNINQKKDMSQSVTVLLRFIKPRAVVDTYNPSYSGG